MGPITRCRSARVIAALVGVVACVAVVGVASPAGAVPVPWKNCGTVSDPIQISKLDASIWPPVTGRTEVLSYRWTTSVPIVRGDEEVVSLTLPSGLHLPAFMPFRPPPPLRFLPIEPGSYSGSSSFTPPLWTPTGVYALHLAAYGRDGTELVCLDMTIPIKSGAPPV